MLLPNDHVRMLLELLRPASPELARRWLAALMLVPPGEREEVVALVESRIVSEYTARGEPPKAEMLHLHSPPLQREGYTERVVRSYARADGAEPARAGGSTPAAGV